MWLLCVTALSRVTLDAKQITYNLDTHKLYAKGAARIQQDGYILQGTDLETDEAFDKASGKNLKVLVEDSSEVSSSRKRGSMETSSDIMDPRFREDDTVGKTYICYFSATSGQKDGVKSTFKDSNFSSCKGCNKDQRLWSIHSKKLVHDDKAERIYHKSATLKAGRLPVFWMPYFSHPDFKAKYQRGWLFPHMAISKEFGTTVGLPYYFPYGDKADLTLTPFITSKEGMAVSAVARKKCALGFSKIDTAWAAHRPYQGHIFWHNYYNWHDNTRFDIDLKRVSSPDYMSRFWWLHRKGFLHYEPLTSQISMKHGYDQGLILFRNYWIQYNQKTTHTIPHWTWDHDWVNAYGALRAHHQLWNKDRFTHGLAFEKNVLLPHGIQCSAHVQERLSHYDNRTWYWIPKGVFKVAWPWLNAKRQWILTPMAQLTLTKPTEGPEIPDYKSYHTLITQSFYGIDHYTARFNVGGSLATPSSYSEWFLDLKRSKSKTDTTAFSKSTLELGQNVRYTCQFSWSYKHCNCQYLENGITFDSKRNQIYFGFIYTPHESSHLHVNGSVALSDTLSLHGGYIGNVDKTIACYGALNFENECLSWDLGVIRRFIRNKSTGEKVNDLGVLLRINLKFQKDDTPTPSLRLPFTPLS